MTEIQKRILIILAIVDVIVVAAMGGVVVITTMRLRAIPTPEKPDIAFSTPILPATWTPTLTPTPRPTIPPRSTNTPTATPTPLPPTPTDTPAPLPTPGPVPILNPGFDLIMPNRIPGWQWSAFVNYRPGDELDPENSYAEPIFTAADDPQRQIDGTTLKIETIRWLKFRAWIHQTVSVTAGSTVYFEIKAKGFSSLDSVIVKAGVDPEGGENCDNAVWGQAMHVNQDSGVATASSPRLTVAEEGAVTMCIAVEPAYPHINNAAFIDQAKLIAAPPRP